MKKKIIGLDIGSNTIKAVQILDESKSFTLLSAGYIQTPLRSLTLANRKEEEILASSINRLIHDMKVSTTEVSASLPSNKVVTRVIQIPQMEEKDLESSINWEAEQYIPWPLSNVKIDFAIIEKDQIFKTMKVLLVAAPIEIIEKYIRIIKLAGLTPIALETEILAIARSSVQSLPTLGNVLLLSLGSLNSEIALLHDQILIYTKSCPIGGDTFTKAISQELGFEKLQAEEYKKSYGLEEDKLEGKIASIINPFLNTLFQEVEKTISYFKEQYPKESLTSIVICGGTAKLPGIIPSITKNLNIDCQLVNPFNNLSIDPNILPILTPDAPIYTASVGLALKEIE